MNDTTFIMTEDHIKLLTNAYVSWEYCEYGAPAIDGKRPYGNSNVVWDIAEILGWIVPSIMTDEEDDDFYDGTGKFEGIHERAEKIHEETQTALQIILRTKSFVPGTYKRDTGWTRNWYLVEE